MMIPEGFSFSQKNLQDYLDCQRRFQLRYLQKRAWPALESHPAEDLERLILLGHRFHQIIHQYIVGIPEVNINETIDEDTLKVWWSNFLMQIGISGELSTIVQEGSQNYPEISISIPNRKYQIVAKYDLITVTREMKFIIFDWKTSKNRPERSWLNKRMQTRIYPYLLVKAGNFLNAGNPINPDHVEMVYWYANHPDRIEKFKYSHEQYLSNEDYLNGLIEKIIQTRDGDYQLTSNKRTCRYCIYRSLCDRGIEAGLLEDISIEPDTDDEIINISLDIDQIAEIEL